MDKDQRLHSQAPSAFTERRQNPRTAIRKPAYINFEPYNRGGVITDISECGLRFHTVDPLEQGGLVRVSIFLGAAHQIDAIGELVWKDSTRRVGGLLFTVLPAGTVDRIRRWADSPSASNPLSAPKIESTTSPQRGESQGPQSPNPALVQADPVSASDTGVSEQRSAAKVPDVAHATGPQTTEGQATRAQAQDHHQSTRPPWVPRSIRPSAATPDTQQRTAQDLSHTSALPPGQPWVPPASYQQPPAMPWITHFDPDTHGRPWPFLRGFLGGIVICVLLGWAGWFAASRNMWPGTAFQFSNPFASHPAASNPGAPLPDAPSAQRPNDAPNFTARDSQASAGQSSVSPDAAPSAGTSSQADPNTQLDSNAKAHPENESAAGATPGLSKDAPLAASGSPQDGPAQATAAALPTSPTLSAAQGSLPSAPQPVAKVPGAPDAPRAADAGEPQLNLARQYLDGRGRPRNPTAASQLLWSAVEKGNSSAETDLADLYLHGDGVARNCDQARVLLSAASGKGNTEAMQKLAELNRTGCR